MHRILSLLLVMMSTASIASAGQNLLEQGIAEYRSERYEEAQELLATAQKEQPESSAIAYQHGLALKQMGHLPQALANFKLSLKYDPVVVEAYPELVEVLYLQDELTEAKQWVTAAESAGIKNASLYFLKGQVLAKKNDNQGAIAAFSEAKKLQPGFAQQSDFQIAQIYMNEGDQEKARETLKSVISGDPSSDLAGFAREYERRLTTAAPRNWHVYLATNLQYDDNAVVKPTTDIPGIVLPTPHDWSSNQNLRVTYDMPTNGSLLFNAQYTFYNNSYFKLDEYSQLSQGITLSPAYRVSNGLMISMPTSFNYTLLGYEAYSNQISTKPTVTAFFGQNHLGQASFGYSRRKFVQNVAPEENRDADTYAGQLGYIFLFSDQKGFFNLRDEVSFENARGSNWPYLGNRFNADLLVPITSLTNVIVSLEGFWQDYLNPNTAAFGIKRSDATYSATVSLSQQLFDELFLNLQYYHATNYSNIDLYEYDRNVYSAGLEVRF